jgi:hypothetical protein
MSGLENFGCRMYDFGFDFVELDFGSVRMYDFGCRMYDFGFLQTKSDSLRVLKG